MARYYRRRYTRVVRPKKKWASNIVVWNSQSIDVSSYAVVLVANKAQSDAPTPTILKTGNFKITADVHFVVSSGSSDPSCMAYIMYVPEGWTVSPAEYDNLIIKHPEWIMATKIMGGDHLSGVAQGFGVETLNMSTRLKRNLNSGDSVVLYLRGVGAAGDISSLNITGNCRYWTCAN